MSIRKREWTTPRGEARTAWLVDYRDPQGKRRAKQFDRKKDAEAWATTAKHEVATGTHTADSQSITIAKAGENWLARGAREQLEQSTLDAYGQHVKLHINPFLGARKLSQLTQPMVEKFRDDLLDGGRSRPMAKRVLGSLYSIIKEAKRLGYVSKNVAEDVTVKVSGRDKAKIVPPSKEHIRLLIGAAKGGRPMDLPMALVFVFAGLRASELRALPWPNVDLQRAQITVDRRADFQNVIGPPKSQSGFRTIPIPPMVVAALRVWKLACPPSPDRLVFPSQKGTPIFHANLVIGFQEPLQIAAGLCRPSIKNGAPAVDKDGAPLMEGLYGLHDLRHACASLWIERRVDAKRVQTWMGHSSIQITFDTYGHLFAALDDDAAVMGELEAAVMTEPKSAPKAIA
ncbi:tyrosine-type recombinase/integrase [Sphingomonas asaccharolytica]|uniref:tyrosine-type recombinase/integrase n=1 Tax=Sphingomonas asaccharolytica TaxID=40681 RepID=UPI000833A663|nr:site-specific integrase [Sphingomonas asaccharolytica]